MISNAKTNCFFAVVKYSSFSKAADHLYISQSAVSKNISQLEKDLGYLLIDRTDGTVRLTAAGKLYYDYLVDADARHNELMSNLKALASSRADAIRLGCLDGWDLSQFYPKIRNIFREKYPGISLSLEGYNHATILDALNEGKIDIGITLRATLPKQGKFSSRTIATAPAVAMFSSSNPLTEREDLTLQDLADEEFYVITPNHSTNNPMEQLTMFLCRNAGFEPKIEYAPNSAAILMRLQGGSGVQITSDWTCAAHFSIYRTLPLGNRLGVSAVWIDDGNTPSKHLFVNELLKLNIDEAEQN